MPGPTNNQESLRVVLTRVVSLDEVERLKASLAKLNYNDVTVVIDADDGTIFRCVIPVEDEEVAIEINTWNPLAPPLIRLSGPSAAAVATANAQLWPANLAVSDLYIRDGGWDDDFSEEL